MSKNKKLFRSAMALMVLIAMATMMLVPVSAAEAASGYVEFETVLNPLYENAEIGHSGRTTKYNAITTSAEPEYISSDEEAAAVLRAGMVARENFIQVYIKLSDLQTLQTHFRNIFVKALEHTGKPTEGDYLKWHYAGYGGGASYYTDGNDYYVTLIYQVSYYTSAAQEAAVDVAVKNLIASMDASLKTNHDKLTYIYDYLCENITYDYNNMNNHGYNLKFSAYAAMINNTAVCQGYTTLLYRLALELGMDCRVIPGIGNGGDHSWNIVELNDKYYNLDATWDSIYTQAGREHNFYLRSNDNFEDHIRNSEYNTVTFNAMYPMSEDDYKNGVSVYTNGILTATYSNIDDAISNTFEGQIITLNDDAVVNASLPHNVYIDLAGFDLSGTLDMNGYVVYGIDNTTNDYTCDSIGFFNCVDKNGIKVEPVHHFRSDVTGSIKRYLSIETEQGYSFHRIYLGITHANLRPNVTGVGYKALFCGDDMVKSELSETTAYGFNLWLGNEGKRVSASKEKSDFESNHSISLSLKNFDVAQYGEEAVNASVFMNLKDGTIIESTECNYTMRSMLEQINSNIGSFSISQLTALKDMCSKYISYIYSWDINNILAL